MDKLEVEWRGPKVARAKVLTFGGDAGKLGLISLEKGLLWEARDGHLTHIHIIIVVL